MKPGKNLPPKFLAAMVAVLPLADGFIVESTFRRGGKFLERLEPERLKQFMEVFVPERKRVLEEGWRPPSP